MRVVSFSRYNGSLLMGFEFIVDRYQLVELDGLTVNHANPLVI